MNWTRRRANLKRKGKTKTDRAYLKALGQNVQHLMKSKGFDSPYDFWINRAGDEISRASLNYIVTGESDPKMTTIRALAKLLGVKPKDVLDFEF
jgi:transcriptional regulator with XRE-family HTH domain